MKNNDNTFDILAGLLTFGVLVSAFSKCDFNDTEDKPKTETKTSEKKCDCKINKTLCKESQSVYEQIKRKMDDIFKDCTKCEINRRYDGYTEIVCSGWLK